MADAQSTQTKGFWQKTKDWYNGNLNEKFDDISPEMRVVAKPLGLVATAALVAFALYGAGCPEAFQRHYPAREQNFLPLVRTDFVKDGRPAIRYFIKQGADRDYTFDSAEDRAQVMDTVIKVFGSYDCAEQVKKEMSLLDIIANGDDHISHEEAKAAIPQRE